MAVNGYLVGNNIRNAALLSLLLYCTCMLRCAERLFLKFYETDQIKAIMLTGSPHI